MYVSVLDCDYAHTSIGSIDIIINIILILDDHYNYY